MTTSGLRRQYAVSLLVSGGIAAAVLSGLLLFVRWAGWAGAAGILSVAGIFLVWFYRGRRPDLEPVIFSGTLSGTRDPRPSS